MKAIRRFEAVCLEPAFYPSGLRFLREGERCVLEIAEGTSTYYVKGEEIGLEEHRPFVFSSDDESWVWEHLAVECAWKKFDEAADGKKEEVQHGKAEEGGPRLGIPADGQGQEGGAEGAGGGHPAGHLSEGVDGLGAGAEDW